MRIEKEYTGGDGCLDKLCMELMVLPSSRSNAQNRMNALVNMIVLAPEDNVGIALRGIAAGEEASDGGGHEIRSGEEVPQGHKIALRQIGAGDPIVRFGVAVGIATSAIDRGRLVHVHNVRSRYLTNDEDHYE